MTISISITGVKETAEALKKAQKEIRKNTEEALAQIGAHLQNQVKDSIKGGKNAPKAYDTGFFHNSTNFAMVSPNTVSIFNDAEYAKYLEFGTSKQNPRPHFRNTAFKEKDKIGKIFKDAVSNAVK